MKKWIMTGLMTAALASVAVAKPVQNVSAKKHPNIAAAQRLVNQAYDKVVAAQKANEYDLEGHAEKAKGLLEQANAELKLAAEASNANK
jgi:F0F1-type ATP synthase membrane subunit b/b'